MLLAAKRKNSDGQIITPLGNLITVAELERRHQKLVEFAQKCSALYEQLKPQLLEQYPGWFIAVNPYTQSYWVDETETGLSEQLDRQFMDSKDPQVTVYRLAEVRATGTLL